MKAPGFQSRDESLAFLKKLWRREKTKCPICGSDLMPLHQKTKKSNCDWQCRNCDKTYRTIHLLDEINGQA